MPAGNSPRRDRIVKRLMDVSVAGLGLVIVSPILAITAGVIRVCMGPPVLFRQVRPGYHGKSFTLVKFRTMREANGPDGKPRADEERITTLGHFLRNSSIDELPQLWNVLKGDMSLIGPRPLLLEYLDRYSAKHARRHDVKPGISGWAQVNGRHHVPMSRRLDMDVWYVDHWSLALDLRILALTAVNVLKMKNVQAVQYDDEIDDLGLTVETQSE